MDLLIRDILQEPFYSLPADRIAPEAYSLQKESLPFPASLLILVNMWIEIFFSGSLLANAILFIPQIVKLYREKDPKGVSLLMFFGFHFIQLSMIFHGLLVKDYLLAGGVFLIFLASLPVTFLILFYHYKNYKARISR